MFIIFQFVISRSLIRLLKLPKLVSPKIVFSFPSGALLFLNSANIFQEKIASIQTLIPIDTKSGTCIKRTRRMIEPARNLEKTFNHFFLLRNFGLAVR